MSRVQPSPGDVLLSRGHGNVAQGIVDLDGGSYSHVAVWSGEKVIESTHPEARQADLKECVEHAHVIDVYRHRDLGSRAPAIIAKASSYVGRDYGIVDLGTSTLVLAVASWMPIDWAEMVTVYGAVSLGRMLNILGVLAQEGQDERVTCSELVVRAHLAADIPITIRLQAGRTFNPVSFLRAVRELAQRVFDPATKRGEPFPDGDWLPTGSFQDELRWLDAFALPTGDDELVARAPSEEWIELRARFFAQVGIGQSPPHDELVPRRLDLSTETLTAKTFLAGRDWPAGLVTPRDIERSPDLVHIGRVHGP